MKKSHTNPSQKRRKSIKNLEEIYLQYLVPMSPDAWKNITSLEQPTLLKQVPTKTSYSTGV